MTSATKTCTCGCAGPSVKAGWCNAAYLRLRRRGTSKRFRESPVLASVDPLFLAWCAGLFEGEGSVGIRRPTARNLGALVVSVPNTQIDIVDPFYSRWGGSLYAADQNNPRHNVIYRWTVRATRAAAFLGEVYPYLRSDKYLRKVALAIQYQGQKSGDQRLIRSPEYATTQSVYYNEMSRLNKRGRDHADTGTPLDQDVQGPHGDGS